MAGIDDKREQEHKQRVKKLKAKTSKMRLAEITDKEKIERAKKLYGFIPSGEEHENYKNDPERDEIGQSMNYERDGRPKTKYPWGNDFPHPDYKKNPNGFYKDGTPKNNDSIGYMEDRINDLTGGLLDRKSKSKSSSGDY
jgi:hypothetical protein